MRPDFDCTIRAGGDHLSGLGGVVLGPGDHFIVNPRRWVRLQNGRLNPINNIAEKERKKSIRKWSEGKDLRLKRNSNAHVKKVPCPDCAVFVPADDASFIKAEACPTPVRCVDVALEVI